MDSESEFGLFDFDFEANFPSPRRIDRHAASTLRQESNNYEDLFADSGMHI
jgi:hypothetical protein